MPTTKLSDVPRALAARGLTPVPTYRMLYMRILDGQLPAEKLPNGRYVVDIDATAKALGLTAERVAA